MKLAAISDQVFLKCLWEIMDTGEVYEENIWRLMNKELSKKYGVKMTMTEFSERMEWLEDEGQIKSEPYKMKWFAE